MSYHEAVADFIGFMEANGVKPEESIASRLATGALIRFRCEGDGKGRQNGWAILYLDERPAGAFGNYRMNTGTLKWKSNTDRPALTEAERAAMRREWDQAKHRREAEIANSQREAALTAAEMWQRATAAAADHPYIACKQIDPFPLRQIGADLLVPMCDSDGLLWNLQTIAGDGTKRFLKGGRINDLFAIVGTFDQSVSGAVFCEGYGTGDAIRRAIGLPVIVAFNTANLPRVARLWNELRPDLHYTVFADDDEATALKDMERTGTYKNPGISVAEAVAAEIGADIAYPLGKPQREAA